MTPSALSRLAHTSSKYALNEAAVVSRFHVGCLMEQLGIGRRKMASALLHEHCVGLVEFPGETAHHQPAQLSVKRSRQRQAWFGCERTVTPCQTRNPTRWEGKGAERTCGSRAASGHP
eukprot:1218094-Rhodomonas_salina.1